MNITLQTTNLDLSDDLRNFVLRKIEESLRVLGDPDGETLHVAVELEKTTNRHVLERDNEQRYRAEANVSVPGQLIRAEESAGEAKQAVVKLKQTLTREIREWRERQIESRRKGARKAKAMTVDADAAAFTEPDRSEGLAEEWSIEEAAQKKTADDQRWEEWEEGGEDQRDYI